MAKILFINTVCSGSTGEICKILYKNEEKNGNECCIAFGRGRLPTGYNCIRIGNDLDVYMHVLKARVMDKSGFGSVKATKAFIKKIKMINPDVIHIHNLHGYYINIKLFFDYLKNNQKLKKIWTLHDCWPITGHCAHFMSVQCMKWQTECQKCEKKSSYPKSLVDRSKKNFQIKKQIFSGIPNLTIVTPSKWLESNVKSSYLNKYDTITIHNGIDMNVFRNVNSNLRNIYGLQNKIVILAVSSVWDKTKGLDYLVKASQYLDEKYKIVIIGLTSYQIKKLPNTVIKIERTKNKEELVKWYSTADIFLNPSVEDTYPTVNLEAIACGTPVIAMQGCGNTESAFSTELNTLYTLSLEELRKKITLVIENKNKLVNIPKEELMQESMLKQYEKIYNN